MTDDAKAATRAYALLRYQVDSEHYLLHACECTNGPYGPTTCVACRALADIEALKAENAELRARLYATGCGHVSATKGVRCRRVYSLGVVRKGEGVGDG